MYKKKSFRRLFVLIVLAIGISLSIANVYHVQLFNQQAAGTGIPQFSHVFFIIEENHGYNQIIGNSQAPYINSLAKKYGLATNYHALSHPSLPNYLQLISGSNMGVTIDCNTCFVNGNNLALQLESAGKTWKSYQESMPANCTKHDAAPYVLRHNPFAYFTNLSSCNINDVPFTQFSRDLSNNTLPNFSWITPNVNNDMHDGTVQQADTWLSQQVPAILQSSAFLNNGLLIITTDESDNNTPTNQVVTIVISPEGKPAFTSNTAYNHYATLRTIEDGFGLSPLGNAVQAAPMADFFSTQAVPTNTPVPTSAPTISLSAGSTIKHVFIVMAENTDWSTIKGNQQAPYINSLLPSFAHTENYTTSDHPSLPNYIYLEAGSNLGMTDGSLLPTTKSLNTTNHLSTYLKNAGYNWKYYAENLPGNGTNCNLSDPGTPYSEDHNANVYFQDVSGNPPNSTNQYCIQHERPYTDFITDLQNNSVPQYSFIVPNDFDEGEKLAPGSNCKLCQNDTWLKNEIPKIQASSAYKDGVIFILWDEGAFPTHNPSGLIVVSPFAKKGYSNGIAYSHASMVRSVEEIFGLKPFLNNAANATDLSDLFTIPIANGSGTSPTQTQNTPIPTPSGTNLTVSAMLDGIASTNTPQHPVRLVSVSLHNLQNSQVNDGQITFNQNSGLFTGTINLGNLTTGDYLVSVSLPGFLPQSFINTIPIISGQTSTAPLIHLINGDIDADNALTVLDYNALVGCFGSRQNNASCQFQPSPQSSGSDLDDDGIVDGTDYNVLLREFSLQSG